MDRKLSEEWERTTSAELLDSPASAYDLSSSKIDTLEAICVAGTGLDLSKVISASLYHATVVADLLLQTVGVPHHRHGLIHVEIIAVLLGCQAQERMTSVRISFFTNEPPRRLGCEECNSQ